MLMDLNTLQWDAELCAALGIPQSMLPRIVSSSEEIGTVAQSGEFNGVPITGILGDQQAATFGQACLGHLLEDALDARAPLFHDPAFAEDACQCGVAQPGHLPHGGDGHAG